MKNSPLPMTSPSARASVLSSKSSAPREFSPNSSLPKSDRRSKLHTSSVVHWLRKRHHDTANTNYLMMPNEQKQHTEVQDVFKIFDADNSGKLALGEFYDMLKYAHIAIDKDDLRQFYKKVDMDNDIALDFQEFKNCTLSDEANFHFAKMMEKIRLESRGDQPQQESQQPRVPVPGMRRESSSKTFQPRTFGNLLNYLTYENKKQSLKEFVNDKQNDLGEKFKKFNELLELHMGKDIYAERLSSRFEPKSLSAERASILSRDSIFKSSSFKPPRVDSINEADGHDTPSDNESSSSEDDKSRDTELIKELDGISRQARQSAREEFFVRTNAKKRHTVVNTGTVDQQQSKRPSFASRDSIRSHGRPFTRNLEETKPSQFRSQRLLTTGDDNTKCSLAIGLSSNEKVPMGGSIGLSSNEKLLIGSKDEVIQTPDDHLVNLEKQKSIRNARNVKVTSVEKIAGWTFHPNTPKKEFIIKSHTETPGKTSLAKFKGSLNIPARMIETSQSKRVKLGSPQAVTASARETFGSLKSTSQRVFTPSLRIAYSGKINFDDLSPEKDVSIFSRQFTATTAAPMSTDRERIQTEPSGTEMKNTRFTFRQPSKMPKNYTMGTPESGSLSSRSHGSQKASKPNTPSSQEKDMTKEKTKRISIFAKPATNAVTAVRE